MQQPGSSYPPGGPGQAKRRGLFAGKGAEQPAIFGTPGDTRVEAMLASYQQAMMERIEEGLRAIQQTGITLMHEIAGEVWRTARGDKDGVQSSILEGLARDQAIRGLIAHSDERFQALAVRTARLEDTLAQMAESTRALKEVVAQGARALHDAATSPTFQGVEDIRERMVEIEQHLQATFERLDERDRILIGNLQQQIRDHGLVLRQETGRIVEALEGYVKDGVDAMGRLAQHAEQQSEQVGARSEETTQQLAERFAEQAQRLEEQTEAARVRSEEFVRRLIERFAEQARRLEEQTEAARVRSEEITGRLTERFEEQAQRLEAQNDLTLTKSEEITGRLTERFEEQAQRLEAQNDLTLTKSEEIIGRLAGTVGEQIQLMYDRIGIETRALTEAFKSHETWILRTLEASSSRFDEGMEAQVEKVRQASREVAGDLARTFENRVYGLAELVRSDSEVLRRQLRDAAAAQSEEMATALDTRLGRVSEALTAATRWTVEEITGRIGRNFEEMTSRISTEFAETTRRSNEENSRALHGRLDEVVTSIDRNMVRLADTLDSELDRLGQAVGQRAAQAAEAAIEGRFDRTLERLNATIESVGRIGEQVERLERVTEDVMNRNLDDRIGALARMIRSDNRILAERMQTAADQEPAKQALRAVKELQASMPADMVEVMDRRFAALTEQLHRDTQAMAESVAKAGEVIGQKVDRIAAQISQRSDSDMQMVIERMGDAMHALASLGKQDQPRIELE